MSGLRKLIFRSMVLFAVLASAGCVAAPVALLPVAAPAVVAGASGGISYTFTNIATRTTNYPMEDVAEASLKALRKMGIEVLGSEKSDEQVYVRARTSKLYIYITVDYMTPVLTKLRVNVKKGLFFKDRETAFEIVLLTERFLQGASQSEPELSGNILSACPPGAGGS